MGKMNGNLAVALRIFTVLTILLGAAVYVGRTLSRVDSTLGEVTSIKEDVNKNEKDIVVVKERVSKVEAIIPRIESQNIRVEKKLDKIMLNMGVK